MPYQVLTANEWLYPDRAVPSAGSRSISLATARGARAASQVLVQADKPGQPVSCAYQCDAGAEGLQPEIYQMVDVAVSQNTGPVGFLVKEGESAQGYVTRLAPFRVYDALKPWEDGVEMRGERMAIYVIFRAPVHANPGRCQGRLVLAVGRERAMIPVSLEVMPATVPAQGQLAVTNWFNVQSMATRHGLALWSEGHWAMIEQYGRLMRSGRQNHFWLPLSLIGIHKSGQDQYSFDFSRAERLMRLLFGLGFTHVDGGHMGTRVVFSDAHFVLTADRSIRATSAEGYVFLAQYLPAWRDFLARHGWLDRALQHVGDEPIDESAQDYRVLAGIVRKLLPGVPIMDAVERPGLAGAVDIWVPKTHYYQEHRAEFDLYRRFGDKIWCYTCCFPGGYHANRLLDMPLLRTRLLHWGNYLYDLVGYLHWGFNHYQDDQDPFEQTTPPPGSEGSTLPPGDTHIIYPGPDRPWSSARFEAMGAGIEDYELLRLVESRDKALAEEIVRGSLRAFDQLDEDPARFAANHRRLLEAASVGG
jgi:hypothetical protein